MPPRFPVMYHDFFVTRKSRLGGKNIINSLSNRKTVSQLHFITTYPFSPLVRGEGAG